MREVSKGVGVHHEGSRRPGDFGGYPIRDFTTVYSWARVFNIASIASTKVDCTHIFLVRIWELGRLSERRVLAVAKWKLSFSSIIQHQEGSPSLNDNCRVRSSSLHQKRVIAPTHRSHLNLHAFQDSSFSAGATPSAGIPYISSHKRPMSTFKFMIS